MMTKQQILRQKPPFYVCEDCKYGKRKGLPKKKFPVQVVDVGESMVFFANGKSEAIPYLIANFSLVPEDWGSRSADSDRVRFGVMTDEQIRSVIDEIPKKERQEEELELFNSLAKEKTGGPWYDYFRRKNEIEKA